MLKALFTKILPFLGITEGSMDVLGLVLRSKEIQEKLKGIFDGLPAEAKAHFQKKANLRVFAQAMDLLSEKERDAINDILAKLRGDQPKQERFMLYAVLTGPELADTAKFLQGLAKMGTDEAVQYLEDLDYTQPSVTGSWFLGVCKKAPGAIAGTVNEFWQLFKKGCQDLGTDFDNTGLPATSQTLRDRAKAWAENVPPRRTP
jgi:hypothetical protein